MTACGTSKRLYLFKTAAISSAVKPALAAFHSDSGVKRYVCKIFGRTLKLRERNQIVPAFVGFRRVNVEQESFIALNDERLIVLHNSILYTERIDRATQMKTNENKYKRNWTAPFADISPSYIAVTGVTCFNNY